ncbi:UMP kinase [Wolbachia endosymbiont of Brugia malayi]|uniref:Uridylate kinase n=1 Tax=Wolbachia sp. subsp. Brugia malayi (strain TRS) TaxID=292805 RepID=PYRH_WOLTR|nr:UMP kinase [Wolbachia endosymbiont of Brugia malayi]Q5GRI0.1 RecName: Full=Uridylate kinase; Short=UK; AltName: Full=Uridine monophosphate kinase; Short=UMP kinase; Short=UMPK [Wolbachia endosymbiont strain TRS of Brugia malayi]AAW71394.1 Uridylate kinase [Wolbachia endosymbiont strain TRS of Brugia malayi]QCB61581.1 UMP kinase [Wolbachia endosymbiont of Brugia malayi]
MHASTGKGSKIKYSRVLFKISGEALMGSRPFGHDMELIDQLCKDISDIYKLGVQVCIVVGGGNIFRGASASLSGCERASSDYIGMLATIINALILQNFLEKNSVNSKVLSAIPMVTICEPYIRRKAIHHLEKGRVVIFAAGTGNPFFTTDTAAALRAVETNCDAILKGTQVNGVYSADPKKNEDAVMYDRLSYMDLLTRDLKVVDASAISLARENSIPIIVFSLKEEKIVNIVKGHGTYTIVSDCE